MELVRKLGTRISKTGKKQSWAVFKCPDCLQEVEKQLSHGKRDKSCGCVRYINSSKKLKGKKRKAFTEEHIKNLRESHKGKKREPFTDAHRQKIKDNHADFKLENAPNWQNGKSFEIYPQEFNRIKKFIYERDKYKCQNPNCIIDNPSRLDCHHIDYDKKNNNLKNLTTLCRSCHMKTNGKNNRVYWAEFYSQIITLRGDLNVSSTS